MPAEMSRGVDLDAAPFLARIGDCEQVCSQIAAIDRGDILRFERSQIARVIPVVEVAAKSLQSLHGRQRCFRGARCFPACRSSRSRER